MDSRLFSARSPGDLVRGVQAGVETFVPHPLPPRLEYDAAFVSAYGAAAAALGSVRESLPEEDGFDPYLMVYPLLTREAYFTSRMENTITTPQQLVLFEGKDREAVAGAGDEDDATRQTRETFNYIRASRKSLELIREGRPVGQHLIRAAHAELLRGVRGEDKTPGQFRTGQVHIGKRKYDAIADARFVPPPPERVPELMNGLEQYVLRAADAPGHPPLVDLALIHYQFETIHPFFDGNGRIGRLLIPLLLCSKGLLPQPLVHMSQVLESRDREYKDRMLEVSTEGRWLEWVIFFLAAFRESAEGTLRKTKELRQLRLKYRQLAVSRRASILLTKLIDEIVRTGSITFNQAARLLNVQHGVAAKHVRALERRGILKEVTGRRRSLEFVAPELLECIFR